MSRTFRSNTTRANAFHVGVAAFAMIIIAVMVALL